MDVKSLSDCRGIDHDEKFITGSSNKLSTPSTTRQPTMIYHRHPGPRSTYCDICQRPFSRPWVLNRHLKSKHGTKLIFHCDIESCNQQFTRKDTLERHKANQHGSSKVPCPSCGKAIRSEGLSAHHNSKACWNGNAVADEVDAFSADRARVSQTPSERRDIQTVLEETGDTSNSDQLMAPTLGSPGASPRNPQLHEIPKDLGPSVPPFDLDEGLDRVVDAANDFLPHHMDPLNQNLGFDVPDLSIQYDPQFMYLAEWVSEDSGALPAFGASTGPILVPDSPRPFFGSDIMDPMFYSRSDIQRSADFIETSLEDRFESEPYQAVAMEEQSPSPRYRGFYLHRRVDGMSRMHLGAFAPESPDSVPNFDMNTTIKNAPVKAGESIHVQEDKSPSTRSFRFFVSTFAQQCRGSFEVFKFRLRFVHEGTHHKGEDYHANWNNTPPQSKPKLLRALDFRRLLR